jgi:hypothetical protein
MATPRPKAGGYEPCAVAFPAPSLREQTGSQACQGSVDGVMPPRFPRQVEGWFSLTADVDGVFVLGLARKVT